MRLTPEPPPLDPAGPVASLSLRCDMQSLPRRPPCERPQRSDWNVRAEARFAHADWPGSAWQPAAPSSLLGLAVTSPVWPHLDVSPEHTPAPAVDPFWPSPTRSPPVPLGTARAVLVP